MLLFWCVSITSRRENIAPDYPLTLLEGLTTITHYCLLDNKKVRLYYALIQLRRANLIYYPLMSVIFSLTVFPLCQSLVACDPVDVRNARNAVLEALPHMLSCMALLWGVVYREEIQKRASDSGHSSKHASTSVYFKSSKVCTCMLLDRVLRLICFVAPTVKENSINVCY